MSILGPNGASYLIIIFYVTLLIACAKLAFKSVTQLTSRTNEAPRCPQIANPNKDYIGLSSRITDAKRIIDNIKDIQYLSFDSLSTFRMPR
jgi:hypothetical protein